MRETERLRVGALGTCWRGREMIARWFAPPWHWDEGCVRRARVFAGAIGSTQRTRPGYSVWSDDGARLCAPTEEGRNRKRHIIYNGPVVRGRAVWVSTVWIRMWKSKLDEARPIINIFYTRSRGPGCNVTRHWPSPSVPVTGPCSVTNSMCMLVSERVWTGPRVPSDTRSWLKV